MIKNNNRELTTFFSLLFILLVLIIISLRTSFAKYKKEINGNVSANIANWNIKVNEEYIRGKKTLNNNIVPTFLGDENTKAGVVAPGSVGYFDLNINASEVDVSFNYLINISVSQDSLLKDLIVTDYILNPDTNSNKIPYSDTGISGVIIKNNPSTSFRIFIKWKDDNVQVHDNIYDTKIGSTTGAKAKLNVNINFSQKKN